MKGRKDLLAYCGIYCGDCLGYTSVIADAGENLKTVIDKYKFEQTAKCIFPTELKEYDKFYEMLEFITKLRCSGKCRTEKDTESCKIRSCCREKGFYACYQCNGFEVCDKLKSSMKGLHTDSCIENLKAIKEMGIETWLNSGKRKMYWM